MSNNKQLLQTAWQFWHAGTDIDVEDMPPPNPSFKAGFDYGMVAAHNEHCATLIRVESLTEALRDAYEAISKSDAAFACIIERSGLSDAHTLADLAEYVRLQADIIDVCQATIRALETENKAFRGDDNGFE